MAKPTQVGIGHERRALREREHEDEVEEELERRYVRLFAQRRLEAAGPGGGGRAHSLILSSRMVGLQARRMARLRACA